MVICIRNWTLHHTSHSLITQKSDIFKAINNSSTTTLFFSSTVCQAYPYIPILDTKLKAHVWENRQIFKPLFLATDTISFMPTVSSGILSWRAFPVLPGMLFLLRKIILKQTLFFPRLKSNHLLVSDRWMPTSHACGFSLYSGILHSTGHDHPAILLLTAPLWHSWACLSVPPIWKTHTSSLLCSSHASSST